MGATATRLTADDYYAITVEGDRKQLVEGEIVVHEPKVMHARLQRRLLVALDNWTAEKPGRGEVLLPTDVRLDEHNVYGPDLLWFRAGREPKDPYAYPEELPDLCVEIRSPGTWRYDVGAKKSVYERAGLPELWLVDDRSETVLAYRRSGPKAGTFDVSLELGGGDAIESPLLPGFALPLAELFAR